MSGFGTGGPESGAPAYDPVIQDQTGFAAVQGHGQDGPELVRNPHLRQDHGLHRLPGRHGCALRPGSDGGGPAHDLNQTNEGALTVSASTDGQLVGLLTALGQLELFADERFNSREALFAYLEAFRQALADAYADFET